MNVPVTHSQTNFELLLLKRSYFFESDRSHPRACLEGLDRGHHPPRPRTAHVHPPSHLRQLRALWRRPFWTLLRSHRQIIPMCPAGWEPRRSTHWRPTTCTPSFSSHRTPGQVKRALKQDGSPKACYRSSEVFKATFPAIVPTPTHLVITGRGGQRACPYFEINYSFPGSYTHSIFSFPSGFLLSRKRVHPVSSTRRGAVFWPLPLSNLSQTQASHGHRTRLALRSTCGHQGS